MIRFRTSFRIAPGLRVNLGKRGVTSVRIGPRGLGVTVGKRGTRVGGALPGPFSWSHRLGTPPTARPGSATGTGTKLFAVLVVALLGGLVLLAAAHAASSANVNIVDGDTLKIDGVTIRIVEIDTPETWQSRCENELKLGLDAKMRLRELIDSGPVRYEPTGTDRYKRILARVYAGDINVGETLLKEGHALRYRAGGKAKLERLRAWCGPSAELDDRWGQ